MAILAIVAVVEVVELIGYLNRVNRKLENFFIAHLSGEMMTSFTKSGASKEFDELYNYFDQVNSKLEKARVENEIRNNYFKTLVDHAAVGLISFTSDGAVGFFNDAARKIFGVQIVRHLEKLDQFREGLSHLLIGLEPHTMELVNIIIKGELIQLATRKVTFTSADKTVHLVSIQNIKSELEQKEVESWQKLIRVLTHEIMNSITPITSLAASLTKLFQNKETGVVKTLEELSSPTLEKTVKGLRIIAGRGEGLVQFVQNYRDVTRLPKPQFQVVSVKELFLLVGGLFEEQLTINKIRLEIDCHPLLLIQADGNMLQQVLINLVKNAIEAFGEKPDPVISLAAQSTAENTVIEVMDNGNGIPAEAMENIFVPFFTTKETGSGIGLSLSRQIIRMHGGSLDVQSVPGSHTIFTIKI
jgi:two-component system nitrogen regulation sensor histidine kinase NtrY